MCCCIPCWPFADVDFEREPVNRYGDKYHYVFNESTRAWELREVTSGNSSSLGTLRGKDPQVETMGHENIESSGRRV
ncbi:unnamed protein product [Sordaria macrospora k-hell]|uniref:WGS project CABT00000000 data, contig 2.13 n=1 Tax=Sordaria macrospora (strain ATCC MYA-333 / DSM 997 / K(L3346) / K-hell) TaxID=771870 RepID=F7VYK9_SORMK|nr:uncharacterized protein SMAC_06455 [Sordaria macrospora k-hell]CCC10604.1 unnamed protein product [Sordaria macrospora k-hell]